jgi:hypothetical protein
LTEETGVITKLVDEPPQSISRKINLSSENILNALGVEKYETMDHDQIMKKMDEWLFRIEFEKNNRSAQYTAEATGMSLSRVKEKVIEYSLGKPKKRPK